MPIYAYRCSDCGFEKDYLRKMSDPLLTDCPQCNNATLAKQVTAAGFQLKGSGWYATDFKNSAKPAGSTKPEAVESDSTKSEAVKSESTESLDSKRDGNKVESAKTAAGKADAPKSESSQSSDVKPTAVTAGRAATQ